jgi:isocitrate dehydrogenase
MNGGGLFETGAGGTAPMLVKMFLENNHFIWDSLGEFLALTASLEHLGNTRNNPKAKVLAAALDKATETLLDNNKTPSDKVGEIDNRGSHFYLAFYWAQELAAQTDDAELQTYFAKLSAAFAENEVKIIEELTTIQGQSVQLDANYFADETLMAKLMRPSASLNAVVDAM